jgi:hypothetical protein
LNRLFGPDPGDKQSKIDSKEGIYSADEVKKHGDWAMDEVTRSF